jgi:hypothetical protein
MMVLDNKFDLKQTVYLITDKDQQAYVVTGMQVCCSGSLLYHVACGVVNYWAADYELTVEKNIECLIK